MTPTEERNKFDASTYVDRAIAMLKDELVPGRINVAAYNGILSLLQYAKESHAASLNRQGWTRVEDGLPEIDTAVFVRTEYESSGKPMVDFFTAYMDEYGDTIICPDDESYGWQFNDVVTHWMPLPNKPSI